MVNQTPGARSAQKAATGHAVLDAAREEFERAGFEGANLRAIARRAGVSAGTVLHHFGDKRELLHAALFDDLEATLEKALAQPGPGPLEAQLQRLTRAVFRYYQRRPALSRALLKESLFAEGAWAARFTAQVGRAHAVVARLTLEAVARGELKKGTNGPLLAAAWFSFFYFALISWVQGGHAKPASLVERLVSQHLEGSRR
jgi:AcrR family transcriptional regulator